MKAIAYYNTILNRLPDTSITAVSVFTKGEVCLKLDSVLKQSK